jgi:hypothetical protein
VPDLPLKSRYNHRKSGMFSIASALLFCGCIKKSVQTISVPSELPVATDGKVNETSTQDASQIAKSRELISGASQSQLLIETPKALQFFQEKCLSCHAEGLAGAKYWSLKKGVQKADLSVDPALPKVYLALIRKYNASKLSSPSAMPPGGILDSNQKLEYSNIILWLQKNFPQAVRVSHTIASDSIEFGEKAVISREFKCETPLSLRKFLRRLSNDALGQEPSRADLELLPQKDLDLPATLEAKKSLVARLFKTDDPWNKIFLEKGLKRFAMYLSGSENIKSEGSVLTPATVNDLQNELHQLLKKYILSKSYREILLLNKVMVTSNTHFLYGTECKAPAEGWEECTLPIERGNFFGTAGFLASKPSSFIENNNNYGRMAAAYLVLNGIQIKPDTNAKGADVGIPLPTCFKTKDARASLKNPADINSEIASYGTAAIPKLNSLCPACHIDRNLALGSIIFRPFGPSGEILSGKIIKDHDPLLKPDEKTNPYFSRLQSATAKGHINDINGTRSQITIDFLASMLEKDTEEGCIDNTKLKNVGDTFEFMIGDGTLLAKGLSQHLPISLSNIAGHSLELETSLAKAWKEGDGKLSALINSYFSSETYSCHDESSKQ